MTHSRRFVAILACCVGVSAVLVGHASAGKIVQERGHGEGSFVDENFCGVGLTVSVDFVFDVNFGVVSRGPDGVTYFLENFRETDVITNPANGQTVTFVVTAGVAKQLSVTDNGDGTLTIVELAAGNEVLYGADGKAIARNPGQSRFELLIDTRGTPDPSDDVLISLERVKGSTGRNDDFCAAAVPALT
jgi:hypothetical protein